MARKITKADADRIDEARGILLQMFPKGTAVHTIIRHVSSSGMTRSIAVLACDAEDGGRIWNASGMVARVVGRKFDDHGGVTCKGVGMDMAFDLVYTLSTALYGDGYALQHRHV